MAAAPKYALGGWSPALWAGERRWETAWGKTGSDGDGADRGRESQGKARVPAGPGTAKGSVGTGSRVTGESGSVLRTLKCDFNVSGIPPQ